MAIVLPKFPAHRPSTAHGASRQPAVNVSLCRDDGTYCAGGFLKASWRVSRVDLNELQGVEVSVLWHTEGKGDEDLGVHHFQRYDVADLRRLGIDESQPIHCRLPSSPLTYRGHLIKIQWGVRVRVFVENRPEVVAEHPFYLVARKPEPVIPVKAELASEPAIDVPSPATFGSRLPAVLRRWRSRSSRNKAAISY